jgi:hypothetical protein
MGALYVFFLVVVLLIPLIQSLIPLIQCTVVCGGDKAEYVTTYYESVSAKILYRYNNLNIVFVLFNPNVLFTYRNVYLVPRLKGVKEFSAPDNPLPREVIVERLNIALQLLADKGIVISEWSVEVFRDYNIVYMNLSNLPLDTIASAIGYAFRDFWTRIWVYDTGLRDFIINYNRLDIIYNVIWNTRNPTHEEIVQKYIELGRKLFDDHEPQKCISSFMGLGGTYVEPRYALSLIAFIGTPDRYEDCSTAINEFSRVVIDIVREYVPEDIPLYILVTDYLPFATPLAPLPTQVNANTTGLSSQTTMSSTPLNTGVNTNPQSTQEISGYYTSTRHSQMETSKQEEVVSLQTGIVLVILASSIAVYVIKRGFKRLP